MSIAFVTRHYVDYDPTMRLPLPFGTSLEKASRRKLPFPAASGLQIAQLSGGQPFEGVRQIPPEQWATLEAAAPQIIVAAPTELSQLIKGVRSGRLTLTSLRHAIFVPVKVGCELLGEDVRRAAWEIFGVSIYQLLVDNRNAIFAAECEAQEGWHLYTGVACDLEAGELVLSCREADRIRTYTYADIQTAPCWCGRPGIRLHNLELMKIGHESRVRLSAIA